MSANAADDFIPDDIRALYEAYNYRNAAQVLKTEFVLMNSARSHRRTACFSIDDCRHPQTGR